MIRASRRAARGAFTRALGLIVSPEREWAAIAADGEGALSILLHHVVPLAVIPAVAWEIGLAVFGLESFQGELPAAVTGRSPVIGAATTFLGSIVCVASFAVALYAIARVHDGRRSWSRAWSTAAYGATPVWLAGALLVQPVLILAVVIAMLHACYLWFVGVQAVLGVRPGAAAECVAIALLIGTVLTMLAGGILGAAGML
jgi:uncharacterized membrane protein YidH (DUF202 family)